MVIEALKRVFWSMADRDDILANFQVSEETLQDKEKEWQSKLYFLRFYTANYSDRRYRSRDCSSRVNRMELRGEFIRIVKKNILFDYFFCAIFFCQQSLNLALEETSSPSFSNDVNMEVLPEPVRDFRNEAGDNKNTTT